MNTEKSNIKILVACHKADPNIRQNDIYTPIQVGKALHPEVDLGFLTDNTGDNISEKNNTYCELTALYWAWKNLTDVDYIGLMHYRRYFCFNKTEFRDIIPTSSNAFNVCSNDSTQIRKLLRKYDVLVSKPAVLPYRAAYDYGIGHHSDDFKTIYNIVSEKFPEYRQSFEKVYLRGNRVSLYNMFIGSWELFSEYCSFLFPILQEAEVRINTRDYTPYQKRLLGFLAERLFNVFISKKQDEGFRIGHAPVIWITEDVKPASKLKYTLNLIRHELAFRLSYVRNPKL